MRGVLGRRPHFTEPDGAKINVQTHIQWRRQREWGEAPPMGGRSKIVYYVCAFIVMDKVG